MSKNTNNSTKKYIFEESKNKSNINLGTLITQQQPKKLSSPYKSPTKSPQKSQSSNSRSSILVTVRVRPLSRQERELSSVESVRVLRGNTICVSDEIAMSKKTVSIKEQQFFYDFVFDRDAGQKEIYDNTTKFLLPGVIDGFNATVFAYGATGSGKTFTMLGEGDKPGIMPRSVVDLFNILNKDKNKEYRMQVSYFEIYNENIRDLLNNGENLDLKEDPSKGTIIPRLKEFEISNADSFFEMLLRGNRKRTVAATGSNETSSRSHAVLRICLDNKDIGSGSCDVNVGKFVLVDLAGSEKQSSNFNNGLNRNAVRRTEGANINKSLLSLGICINALASKSKFIPWRDSKLTRILKDSLGGNSRTVMICTVSPSLFCVDETVNTLTYANRAKNIQTIIKKNVFSAVDVEQQINKYDEIISQLNGELEGLRHQLAVKTHNKYLLQAKNINENNLNMKAEKLSKEICSHFDNEIRIKNEILGIEKTISVLDGQIKDKEFMLYKMINNSNKANQGVMVRSINNNYIREKELKTQINKLIEKVNLQKTLLVSKETKYNEIFNKRAFLETSISKFGQLTNNINNSNQNTNSNIDNNSNTNNNQGMSKMVSPNNSSSQFHQNSRAFSSLQYLYHSYVFEINNMQNEFVRKQNLNEIRTKDLKIQKLIEQLKIRDEYIRNERREMEEKKIAFNFEGEKEIKSVEELNLDKSYSIPFILQQDNNEINNNMNGINNINNISVSNTNASTIRANATGRASPVRQRTANSARKYDYSGYSNPNIIKHKKVIKTKTNEIMRRTKNHQLTQLKLNILNDQFKNSKVFYVNRGLEKNSSGLEQDKNYIITFDTRFLNKSHSSGNISNRTQSDKLNVSGQSRSIINYKEREIDNKIKRIMVGKTKANPYIKNYK